MSFSYTYTVDDLFASSFFMTFLGIGLISALIAVIAYWKIFSKAGEPGWAAIVPFYNLYELYKITWGNGIFFLLLLIPIARWVIGIITSVKLANAFGKGGGFACGLIFLPDIFLLILAFGSAQYLGPDGQGSYNPNGYNPNGYNPNMQGGYGQGGYNPNMQGGYGQGGYNPNMQGGYNQNGYNPGMQGGYNPNPQGGYDPNGYNQNGYNPQGGYNQNGNYPNGMQ